jgi:hypothetical protein
MKQLMYLDTTPLEEKCVGVGHPDYLILAKIECMVYIQQLQREHPKMPERFQFKIERCPYDCDLGFYWDVVLQYNDADEKDEDYAVNIEDNLPMKWDEKSLKVLMSFPEYNHWMADPKTPFKHNVIRVDTEDRVREAIRIVEEAGGIVMIQEPEEEKKFEELVNEKPQVTRISIEQLEKQTGMSCDDLMAEATFDGICYALCSYGCETEPDGRCSHGNPSILLAMGVI